MSTHPPQPQLPLLKSFPRHLPFGVGQCSALSQAPSLPRPCVTSDEASSTPWGQEWASCRRLGVWELGRNSCKCRGAGEKGENGRQELERAQQPPGRLWVWKGC